MTSLIEATQGNGIENTVIVFLSGGELRSRLELAGVTVIELGASRGATGALVFPGMVKAIQRSRPDIVQAWMYHAIIATTIASLFRLFDSPLVWNVRQSLERHDLDRILTRLLFSLAAKLSRCADAIVYNSNKGAETHEAIGFAQDRRHVVFNGIDCQRFRPLDEYRERLRAELGVSSQNALIGRVARYAPMKDFVTLLAAFRQVLVDLPNATLVLVGAGCSDKNSELIDLCKKNGCADNVRMLGSRRDIEKIYPAFDVLVSSSVANEGFPNVIAEALASGTLVVSTAVGESKLVRNGCHVVVDPGNAEGLAKGITSLLRMPQEKRDLLSGIGRRFIEKNFALELKKARYLSLYSQIVRMKSRR